MTKGKDEPRPLRGYNPSDKARKLLAETCRLFGLDRTAWYIEDTQGASVPAIVAMKATERAISRRDFTAQWYAERFRRLEDLGKAHGIWPEMAEIMANGNATGEPPTYAQQLNRALHRAELAERELVRLKAERD